MVSKDILKRQFLFEDISEEHLDDLVSAITELSLKKGDTLFSEKDETKGIYLIRSGKVEVSKKTPDGWKQKLAVFSKGHFFGELSIMESRMHEADATVVEDSTLLLLSKEGFERIEKENLPLALALTKKIAITMSQNLRKMNERFMKALVNY